MAVSIQVCVCTQAPSIKRARRLPREAPTPSLTWKESWNLLSRNVGAFHESQSRSLGNLLKVLEQRFSTFFCLTAHTN